MLSNLEIAKVYKYYMKQYFVKPDIELYSEFQKRIKKGELVQYCFGSRYTLLQCGLAYLDYEQTYKQHTQIFSYDILNAFLHLDEDQYSQVFYEYPTCPLVIYHPTATTNNLRLMSLITHLYSYRSLEKQKTLILSETSILPQIIDKITPITDLSGVGESILTSEVYGD